MSWASSFLFLVVNIISLFRDFRKIGIQGLHIISGPVLFQKTGLCGGSSEGEGNEKKETLEALLLQGFFVWLK